MIDNKAESTNEKFELGRIVILRGVIAEIPREEIDLALQRHRVGDWGEVCEEDAATNDRAVRKDLSIMSVYKSKGGTEFWIITEGDRSVTTILLPDEY